MRLTCPHCAAQYEIPDSTIPASGREVECSACTHVWHQSASAPAIPEPIAEPGPGSGAPYDPAARPTLNRPLHESVLAILREEAARELSARAAPTADVPAPADPNHRALPSAAARPTADESDRPAALPAAGVPGADDSADRSAPAAPPSPSDLPDAARLAATLTRRLEPAALPDPAEDVAPSPPPAAIHTVPATPRRLGYPAGFGLAVLISLALLAAYVSAPESGDAPRSEWREQVDRGRIWLHDRVSNLRAAIVAD